MKKWNTTKLMVAGGFGVLNIIIAFAGMGITVVTGITASSGFINSLTGAFLTVLLIFIIQKFGAATIKGFVYSVIALPLPLLLTPGFFPKIIIGILSGLVADIVYVILRKRPNLCAFLIGGTSQIFIAIIMFLFGKLYPSLGLEYMAKLLFSPLALVYFLFLGIAGVLGYKTYKKIEHSSFVKRIQK